ncbi:MAG: serine hydrolase [Anaerolineae bacterium]|nr:serine hydrolase [Anaerolineae bacterium]
MNSRSTPGMGQWLVMTVIVASAIFLLYKIYQYGTFRQYLPAGLTVAGVDVGGLTREEAGSLLTSRYLDAEVVLYHGEQTISIDPSDDADFKLDLETMLNQADFQRDQQDFWAGFWGFLWQRPIEVEMVELRATHNPATLQRTLETIATSFDNPAQRPQPVPATLSFQYGEPGVRTDVTASMDEVIAALYRPTRREAHLTLRASEANRPEIALLGNLLVNHLQNARFQGVTSIFILDLGTGEEVRIKAGQAMSGIDLLKLPIVIEAYRFLDNEPTPAQLRVITETLTTTEPDGAIALLNMIAGQENPHRGAQLTTESLWRLGLKNSFIATPYGQPERGAVTYDTPANNSPEMETSPDPAIQTTAEDIGTLLAMLYYCAETGGGALRAAHPAELVQAECQQIVELMQRNRIGSLIEQGVPSETPVAHRHGWSGDTHADAGIVFSPGGDYVLVEIFHQPDWLPWDQSSPLMADISRATYNYFNFDSPYLGSSRIN